MLVKDLFDVEFFGVDNIYIEDDNKRYLNVYDEPTINILIDRYGDFKILKWGLCLHHDLDTASHIRDIVLTLDTES